MATLQQERKLLQRFVGACALIPILAGLDGVLSGARMMGGMTLALSGVTLGLDSHFRFLSGTLLAIGIAYIISIPNIELHRDRFRLLTGILVLGALARVLGVIFTDLHSIFTLLTIAAELLLPLFICVWQHRVASRMATDLP